MTNKHFFSAIVAAAALLATTGGYFVFTQKVFDYLRPDSVLEEQPLRTMAEQSQLAVYEHNDFWMCMDTYKDVERLNRMWSEGTRPWVVWA